MGNHQHGAFGVKLQAVPQKILVGGKYRVELRKVPSTLSSTNQKLLFFVFAGSLMGWNAQKHEEDARQYAVNFKGFTGWQERILNWVSLPRLNQTVHLDKAVPPRLQLDDLWEWFEDRAAIRMGAIGARYYDLKANIKYCRPTINKAVLSSSVRLTWQLL